MIFIASNYVIIDNIIKSPYSYAQQIEKNPGFQDSFWTDKSIAAGNDSTKLEEKEVGPGEGTSTLAVVLVNKAQSDISAIKGFLTLPNEFQAIERESNNSNALDVVNNTSFSNHELEIFTRNFGNTNISNTAVASYNSIVTPGQEFTLYFDIYINNDARVGSHYGKLDLVYSKVLTSGDIVVKDIPISFRIPGKAILDVETQNQYLSPAQINNVDVDIINKGSADANSVIITISNTDDNGEENLATVSESASNEFIQQPNSATNNSTNTTLSSSNADDQADNNVTSSSITTLGTLKYVVGNIPPGEIISINSLIYPAITAAGTLQNLDIQISYGNSIGNRETVNYNLGLVINAEPKESNFNIQLGNNAIDNKLDSNQDEINNNTSNDNIVTAGSIEELNFAIKKSSGESDIKDGVISLQPSSESVKILGPSRWSFDAINNDTSLSTTIFVSDELIGKPIQLSFNIDYLLDGIAKSETLDLGFYVEGKIAIRAYDFEINIIGDEPNLISNLLNEGNTDAFFTTAEMIPPLNVNTTLSEKDSENSTMGLVEEYPPVQYLGDLAENSPLPISIPLKIPNNTSSGNYPIFIKVSYKDNLRNDHQLMVNGTVNYSPQIENASNNNGLFFGTINPIILLGLIFFFGIAVYLILRRYRKKKKNQTLKSSKVNIESENDLDSILSSRD